MIAGQKIPWGRIAQRGLIAGVFGAIVFDLYLWATTVLPAHGSMIGLWQWIASTALGKLAFSSPSFAATGLAILVVTSVVWAGAYAYVAAVRPFVNRRWAISGPVYGLVVYLLIQIVLLVDNNFVYPPTPNAFLVAVIGHVVFFGLPVAFVVNRLQTA